MIADPNPNIEPWSFDGGPTLPSRTLTPTERKRTGHIFAKCPNPIEPADRKADGAAPCSVCLLVQKAVDHEVELWRAIQEQKAQTWRTDAVETNRDEADDYIPPPPPIVSMMATVSQVALMVKLAAEKTPQWFNSTGQEGVERRAQERTKSQADAAIKKLIAMPTIAGETQMKRGAIKAGHYAIQTVEGSVNTLAFYKVDIPTSGKWAGYTFVKRVIGGQSDSNVPRAQAAGILARIQADEDAGPRYGREIGRCCMCNRTLTNDESRANGIGPECATKGT